MSIKRTKKIFLGVIMLMVFLFTSSLTADCYSDCDYGCEDYYQSGDIQLWIRCLMECYEHCVHSGGGDTGGGPYSY